MVIAVLRDKTVIITRKNCHDRAAILFESGCSFVAPSNWAGSLAHFRYTTVHMCYVEAQSRLKKAAGHLEVVTLERGGARCSPAWQEQGAIRKSTTPCLRQQGVMRLF